MNSGNSMFIHSVMDSHVHVKSRTWSWPRLDISQLLGMWRRALSTAWFSLKKVFPIKPSQIFHLICSNYLLIYILTFWWQYDINSSLLCPQELKKGKFGQNSCCAAVNKQLCECHVLFSFISEPCSPCFSGSPDLVKLLVERWDLTFVSICPKQMYNIQSDRVRAVSSGD